MPETIYIDERRIALVPVDVPCHAKVSYLGDPGGILAGQKDVPSCYVPVDEASGLQVPAALGNILGYL